MANIRSKAASAGKEPSTGGVMAIRLMLSILEALAKQNSVGVTELSKALGTTKARVFRHLRTLMGQGYAVQDPGSERYAAGPRLVALSRILALSPDDSVIQLAKPVMMRLRNQFGHAVNLSLVYGDSASIVETLQGSSFADVVMRTHIPMPLHATAAGKLLMADIMARGLPLPQPPYQKFTENTIGDREILRAELEQILERGWATAPEEIVLGLNAISAPIRGHRGELVAMISIAGSVQFLPKEPGQDVIDAIKRAADEISKALAL